MFLSHADKRLMVSSLSALCDDVRTLDREILDPCATGSGNCGFDDVKRRNEANQKQKKRVRDHQKLGIRVNTSLCLTLCETVDSFLFGVAASAANQPRVRLARGS